MIGYIPSPPSNGITVGSFELHFYGLLIAIGVLAAAWLAQRRWVHLGGFSGTMVPIAFWAVVAGLIGARLYSVATSWQQDTGGNPVQILEIWNGGLGIWGAVAGGVFGGWLAARRMHVPLPPLLDVVAPALPLAQAIGRWGNYFNQELFGRPSTLPWAVRITNQVQLGNIYPPKYRPPVVDGVYLPGTFQPTFLYECIWDLATVGLVLLVERKVKLRRGYLFAAYAAIYTFGRFFTEYLRIDPSHRYLGLRLNDWTSVGVFLAAGALLLLKGRPKPGDDLVGEPLPAAVQAAEKARADQAARRGQPPAAEEEAEEEEEVGGPAPGGAEPNQDKPSQEKPSQDKQAAAAGGTGGGQTDAVGGEAAAAAVAVATKEEKGAEERTTEDGEGVGRSPGEESLVEESPVEESPVEESRGEAASSEPPAPSSEWPGAEDRTTEANSAQVSSAAGDGTGPTPPAPQDGKTT